MTGEDYEFHKDSIWAMEISSDFNYIYSGGKDGCIYEIDLNKDRT